jgi:protein TonB
MTLLSFFPFSALRAVTLVLSVTTLLITGCSSIKSPTLVNALAARKQNLSILSRYKVELAQHISKINTAFTTADRPQSMLRSVVVVAFKLDNQGRVLTSSIYRTNGDSNAERIALTSLRQSSPLPAPPEILMGQNSEIEVMEDWLFNSDGRFQLRSIAAPQYGLN